MRFKYTLSMTTGLAVGLLSGLRAEEAVRSSFTPLGQNSYRFDWTGQEGLTYFPQHSFDLINWTYLPEVDNGLFHDPIDFMATDEDGIPFPRLFMRLQTSSYPTLDPKNADFDGDGLSNWQELTVSRTDPLKSDTDGDGLPDGQEDTDADGLSDQWERGLIERSEDPGSASLASIMPNGDFDEDGLSNLFEYQNGLSGYEADSDGDGYSDRLSVDQQLYLGLNELEGSIANDGSAEAHHGTLLSTPLWKSVDGVENGAIEFDSGGDAVGLPKEVFHGKSNVTISLWFQTSNVAASRTLLSAMGSVASSKLSIGIENGNTIRFVSGSGNSAAWNIGKNLADGLWHHLVIVRNSTSGQVALRLDGAPFGTAQALSLSPISVDAVVLGQDHQTASSYDPAKAFIGLLDQVRIYSAALEDRYLTELFQPNDLDLDGLPDNWELFHLDSLAPLAAADDDLDEDGRSNRKEFEMGSDPDDYYNGITPVITLASGANQTVLNGERTATPLVFLVTDGVNPLVNAPVDLSHLEQIGSLETLNGDTLATSMTLRSDAEGKVSVHFRAD